MSLMPIKTHYKNPLSREKIKTSSTVKEIRPEIDDPIEVSNLFESLVIFQLSTPT